MTRVKKLLAVAALVAMAAPAAAHDVDCSTFTGALRADAAGNPILGEDGLPDFKTLSEGFAGGFVLQYPATVGIQVTIKNAVQDTSVIESFWSSLAGNPAIRWYGQPITPGLALPIGGTTQAMAVATVRDQAECRAAFGARAVGTQQCNGNVCEQIPNLGQPRFVITHEAGSTECRALVYCDTARAPLAIGAPQPIPGGGTIERVPSGTSEGLLGVWGTSATDVWAVGGGGTILHWDGMAWSPVTSGTAQNLLQVWAASADDAWATGDGVILHWDGTTWSTAVDEPGTTFSGVWGSGPDDVWVAAVNELRHWDGTRWATVTPIDPFYGLGSHLWGLSRDDVWATNDFHWDGTAWSRERVPLFGELWGTGPDDLFRLTMSYIARVRPGQPMMLEGFPATSFRAIWGFSASDVWAVGASVYVGLGEVFHWDGSAWTPLPFSAESSLQDVWGSAPDDVWAVGESGTILRIH